MKLTDTDIIKYLLESNLWVPTKKISIDLNVSVRTIRSYVSNLNSRYNGIILSSRYGYKINEDVAKSYLINLKKIDVPQTQSDRVRYIIQKLITNYAANQHISLESIEDELFISSTTLQNDLKIVRKELTDQDLKLENNNNILTIHGSEKNKRAAISRLIYSEVNGAFISETRIQTFFPNYDIKYIYKIVRKELSQYHLFYNDYALSSLILHIIILLDRVQHGLTYSNRPLENSNKEYEVSKHIANNLSNHFSIKLPAQEIYEISLLLHNRTSSLDFKELKATDLIKEFGHTSYNLTKQLIDEVDKVYYVHLNNIDFLSKLTFHIHNLLTRSRTSYRNQNPLTMTIKKQYPMIFEIALYISNRLNEICNIKINSDEIAYIALHIGGELESQQDIENKISCIIYSPQYYDQNLLIVKKLKKTFPSLIIEGVTSNITDLPKNKKIDCIISTLEFNSSVNVPFIYISPFLGQMDLKKVEKAIEDLTVKKNMLEFKKWLEEFINKDLFHINSSLDDKTSILQYMTKILVKKNYVDNDFLNQVLKRENLSPTAFGNIAIPHTLKMVAKRTGIFVFLSKKPINWDNKNVQVILLLAINKEDSNTFRKLYENLISIFSDTKNINRLLNSINYKDFITKLSKISLN